MEEEDREAMDLEFNHMDLLNLIDQMSPLKEDKSPSPPPEPATVPPPPVVPKVSVFGKSSLSSGAPSNAPMIGAPQIGASQSALPPPKPPIPGGGAFAVDVLAGRAMPKADFKRAKWFDMELGYLFETIEFFGHGNYEKLCSTLSRSQKQVQKYLKKTYTTMNMNIDKITLKPLHIPDPQFFKVTLRKTDNLGLGLNIGHRHGFTMVLGFRTFEDGSESPTLKCGKIAVGDVFAKVDGKEVFNVPMADLVKVLTSTDTVINLEFMRVHRLSWKNVFYKEREQFSIPKAGNFDPAPVTCGSFRGVELLPNGKYQACGIVEGSKVIFGNYDSLPLAAASYDNAVMVYRGLSQDAKTLYNFKTKVSEELLTFPIGELVAPPSSAMHRTEFLFAAPPVQRVAPSILLPVGETFIAEFEEAMLVQLKAQIKVHELFKNGQLPSLDDVNDALRTGYVQPTPDFVPAIEPIKKIAPKRKKSESDDDFGSSNHKRTHYDTEERRQSDRAAVGSNLNLAIDKAPDDDEDEETRKKRNKQLREANGPLIESIVAIRIEKESYGVEVGVTHIYAYADEDIDHMKFLIKYKGISYLHLFWKTKAEISVSEGPYGIRKIKSALEKHPPIEIFNGQEKPLTDYFDNDFIVVDRILRCVEGIREIKVKGTGMLAYDRIQQVKQRKYLVKWLGLSYAKSTWEWSDVISNELKIAEFARYQHGPALTGMGYNFSGNKDERRMLEHQAALQSRPPPEAWKRYSESVIYKGGNTLRSYQLEGLNWLTFCWYNRRNAILADEMGLGKTVQVVSMMEHLRSREQIRGPFLIIAPLATLPHWKREVEGWTTMNCVTYHDHEGGAAARNEIRKYEFYFDDPKYQRHNPPIYKFNVLLTSYSIVTQDWEILSQIKWKVVVVDEAHRLKDANSKLTLKMRELKTESLLLLTGTPLQNNMNELFSLLNLIDNIKFANQFTFMNQYGNMADSTHVANLQELLRPYMLRRVKSDVEKSLPSKEETIIDIELTTVQKKYYRAIYERNRQLLCSFSGSTMGSSASNKIGQFVNIEMELRKCCNHPFLIRGVEDLEVKTQLQSDYIHKLINTSGKMVLMDKLLAKLFKEGSKVLIFSQFVKMLDLLESLLMSKNYSFLRLDGSTKGDQRQSSIDKFSKKDSSIFAFLLSTRAGGVGLNLTAADTAIIFDSDWNPQNDLQAQARIHRIGQEKKVRIYRLVTRKSYEAEMFNRSSKKLGLSQAVFETGGMKFNEDGEEKDEKEINSILDMDKETIDRLLKYGAYAIAENEKESEEASNNFIEADIDKILSNSKTVVFGNESDANNKASLLNFNKATFQSSNADSKIDFNDDHFWEKILGPRVCDALFKRLTEDNLESASDKEKFDFMKDLGALALAVATSAQNSEIHPEQDVLISILIELQIRFKDRDIIKNFLAANEYISMTQMSLFWIEDIEKPKRNRALNLYKYLQSSSKVIEVLDPPRTTSPLPDSNSSAMEGGKEVKKETIERSSFVKSDITVRVKMTTDYVLRKDTYAVLEAMNYTPLAAVKGKPGKPKKVEEYTFDPFGGSTNKIKLPKKKKMGPSMIQDHSQNALYHSSNIINIIPDLHEIISSSVSELPTPPPPSTSGEVKKPKFKLALMDGRVV